MASFPSDFLRSLQSHPEVMVFLALISRAQVSPCSTYLASLSAIKEQQDSRYAVDPLLQEAYAGSAYSLPQVFTSPGEGSQNRITQGSGTLQKHQHVAIVVDDAIRLAQHNFLIFLASCLCHKFTPSLGCLDYRPSTRRGPWRKCCCFACLQC